MAVVGVSVAFLLILSVVQACVSDTCSRECPNFWTRFGDNCYRFFGTPKTWQEAENQCQEFFTRYGQGHLASVSNQDESEFLQHLLGSSLVPHDGITGTMVWIGLKDVERARIFVWSDGKHVGFIQWHKGEPNNVEGEEDCVTFWKLSGGVVAWNDLSCSEILTYICQISTV